MGKDVFSDLFLRPQYRNTPVIKDDKTVLGFDTETHNGTAFLMCCSDGKVNRLDCWDDVVNAVFHVEYSKTLNLFYNLRFDSMALLKYLPREELRTLHLLNKVEYGGVRIRLIPRKLLSLRRNNRTVLIYDLAQYFMRSLDSASQEYLKESKGSIDVTKFSDMRFVRRNWDEIVRYCLQDCALTQKLGVYYQKLCGRAGLDFNRPLSPANIAGRYYMSNCDIPILRSRKVLEYAFKCYAGGRFEVFQRGYFPKLYKYDIRSAYPFEMAKLIDISLGGWYFSDVFMERAYYGFLRCRLRSEPGVIQPLPTKIKGLSVYPQFRDKEVFISLEEYRFIEERGLGTLDFIDGVFFYPSEERKVYTVIPELYRFRKSLKDKGDGLEKVIKVMLNSPYGKLIERTKSFQECDGTEEGEEYVDVVDGSRLETLKVKWCTGNFFNPVYASIITANTRLRLLKASLKVSDSIVAMFTDCVMSTKRLDISSPGLGGWDYEGCYESVVVGSGVYTVRKDDYFLTRLRGFRASNKIDLFKLLAKNRTKNKISVPQKHVLGLGECLAHVNKWTVEDINRFVVMPKRIDINFDRKREWESRLRNAGCLLDGSMTSASLIY